MRDLGLRRPLLIRPDVHEDERGFFLETWSSLASEKHGLPEFVQDNHSRSKLGVLRGMHFQKGRGQAKLVRVARGTIFDVIVDLRRDSPEFGKWTGFKLDAMRHEQLFVPAGFAHGFMALTDADVCYKVDTPYDPELERTFAWNDATVSIDWLGVRNPLLSARDAAAPSLDELMDRGDV